MSASTVFFGDAQDVRLFAVDSIHRDSNIPSSESESQQRVMVRLDPRLEQLATDVQFVRIAREERQSLELNVETLLGDDFAVFFVPDVFQSDASMGQ